MRGHSIILPKNSYGFIDFPTKLHTVESSQFVKKLTHGKKKIGFWYVFLYKIGRALTGSVGRCLTWLVEVAHLV